MILTNLASSQTTTEDWFKTGTMLSYQGDYNGAINAFDRAIELDSTNDKAWLEKGYALYAIGKYDDALTCFERVTQIDSQNEEAWSNKVQVLKNLGRISDAREALAEAEKTGVKVSDETGSYEASKDIEKDLADLKETGLKRDITPELSGWPGSISSEMVNRSSLHPNRFDRDLEGLLLSKTGRIVFLSVKPQRMIVSWEGKPREFEERLDLEIEGDKTILTYGLEKDGKSECNFLIDLLRDAIANDWIVTLYYYPYPEINLISYFEIRK